MNGTSKPQEWHEQRRTAIGGSAIGRIAGLCPPTWGGPLDEYMRIVENEQRPETSAQEWGTRNEPAIRQKCADLHGVEIIVPGFTRDSVYPWIGVNVDGDIPELDAILECKNHSEWVEALYESGPPDHELAQCQWGMRARNRSKAILAVLFGGSTYREWIIERDDALIAELIEIGRVFWTEHVEKRIPPTGMIGTTDAKLAYLRSRARNRLALPDGDPMLAVVEKYRAAAERLKDAEADKEALAGALAVEMARLGAESVKGPGWTATYIRKEGNPKWREIAEALAPGGVPDSLINKHRGNGSEYVTVATPRKKE